MHRVRKSKGPEILLALLKGPKHVRALQSEVGGSALTVEMRIQELLKDGYIEEQESKAWPFRKMLKLTEQGRKLATYLKLETSLFGPSRRVSPEEAKEKGKWLLALLHAMGGAIEGSTRLQKLFFLAKHEFGLIELPYDFLPFLHGPFSDGINDDVLDLENAGLLEVQREMVEPTFFRLTSNGARLAKAIFEKMPEKHKEALTKVRRFNRMGLGELLEYVYKKYPEESKA